MEHLAAILSFATAALGFLVTTITFILKFIKSEKAKKVSEQVIDISNAIIPYIQQAETFVNYTGEQKKAFVIEKATQYATDNGIDFDADYVGTKIDELVGMTKNVNSK